MILYFLAGIGAIVVLLSLLLVASYLAAVEEQIDRIQSGSLDPGDEDVFPLARWWTTGRWE